MQELAPKHLEEKVAVVTDHSRQMRFPREELAVLAEEEHLSDSHQVHYLLLLVVVEVAEAEADQGRPQSFREQEADSGAVQTHSDKLALVERCLLEESPVDH
jgi:hypothetical protein